MTTRDESDEDLMVAWWRGDRAAGALLLITATVLLVVAFPWSESVEGSLTLEVTPAPAPGAYAPPTLGGVLLITQKVAEVRVKEATQSKLDAELIKVVHGDPKGVPARISLVVSLAVSELEAETVKAVPGELMLLLLREEDGKLVLATGNPWSIVSARSTSFMWTFDLHSKPYDERRAMVLETLALRDLLQKTKWEEQASHLARAISSADPLRREFAMDWYRMYRKGWPSNEVSLVPEQQETKPALAEVGQALLPLLLPRTDAISTIVGSAADLLALHPPQRWAEELGDPGQAEITVILFREMKRILQYTSRREEVQMALESVDKSKNPTAAYLAAALLNRRVAMRAAKLDETARAALTKWKHVPAWPPERLLAWLGSDD